MLKAMKKTALVAACSFELNASSDHFVIVPEGEFRGLDGRPFDAPYWKVTPEKGQQLVAALNQKTIDTVIDYDHSNLYGIKDGNPKPAAGWLKAGAFAYVQGVGVCSTSYEWTDKAAELIAANEYKYLSPVFFYNKAGEVLSVLNTTLTNVPNLDSLPAARLAAAAQDYFTQNLTDEDSSMDELLEHLRWMLNLPISATAEDIKAELQKLIAQINDATGVAMAANGQSFKDVLEAFSAKLAANSQAAPDPTQYVPFGVYKEAVDKAASAQAAVQSKAVDDAILAACSDGRLTGEATIDYYKGLAKTNPDLVIQQLDELPKIAALSQQQTQQLN